MEALHMYKLKNNQMRQINHQGEKFQMNLKQIQDKGSNMQSGTKVLTSKTLIIKLIILIWISPTYHQRILTKVETICYLLRQEILI